jgi:hypothetical protein
LPASTGGQFSPRSSWTGPALEVLKGAALGAGGDDGGDGPDDAPGATDLP